MAGNPAWDRLLQSQAVLVLQGPVGPLLAKLALKLAKNGKVVRRVVFNAGDRQNASTHPSSLLHPFNGPMENLPNWFRNLCVKHGIETVVLFGQSRPCHAAVIPVAKALGITVLVMEEGYFRPGYLTLEMDGVNGHSATLDRFVWQPSAQTISTLNPHECKHHFFKTAVHAIRYYLAMFMGQRAFPHYVHHRETSPTWYVRYWLKSWITKWRRFGQDHDQHQALVKMGPPYFLIPLQHDGDAQIIHHTLGTLVAFAHQQGLPMPPATVALLAPAALPEPVLSTRPLERPYFVVLGTIEPRKNHVLLLTLWRDLVARRGQDAPHLVVIGQRGWECESVVDLLERCEALRGWVHEVPGCSDAELSRYLRHAQALLFPSFTEGYGMPLAEALQAGTPVLASELPVFREIAGDVPEYLSPLDGLGWLQAIEAYAASDSPRRQAQLQRMQSLVLPTWEQHFAQVQTLLDRIGKSIGPH